nr:hypothetical protein [Escherichia coli]
MAPFSLLALCGHEQPDCQEGRFPPGTGMNVRKRLARTVLIFTERSDQLSRATDRVPGLPASPGYAQ